MSKYVPDISSHRWVIISPQRTERPDDFGHKTDEVCHFCPGNERFTQGEVLRFGEGEKDTPGWKLRVFPNKYPITDFHEIIVHSPDCFKDFDQLELNQVELIFEAYKQRYTFYEKKGQVLIFCNHGEHAGASIEHPHSQLVVIPGQINLDTLVREPLNNIVEENEYFQIYCPEFSQWPYEVWIVPRRENTTFSSITSGEIKHMSMSMKSLISMLKKVHKTSKWADQAFGYNYYIYPHENWYLRIIPRFVYRAGFELGTGLQVNIIDPKDAANSLRNLEHEVEDILSKLERQIK